MRTIRQTLKLRVAAFKAPQNKRTICNYNFQTIKKHNENAKDVWRAYSTDIFFLSHRTTIIIETTKAKYTEKHEFTVREEWNWTKSNEKYIFAINSSEAQ